MVKMSVNCVSDIFYSLKQLNLITSTKKTLQVVGIMRMNVEKVLERDQKLSELDDRAGNNEHKNVGKMKHETRIRRLPTW